MKKLLALAFAIGLGLTFVGEASAEVRLAVGGPITGGSAAFGAQLKNGVEQATADINAAGGILGQHITLSVGDDRADPKEGVSVANKFVGDGVKFVVGHFNSGVTISSSDVYQENGMLMITPAATNPQVTDRKMWNVFRVCGRDDQQGSVAGNIIAARFKGKRVAIVHDKTTYGQGLALETRKAMRAHGLREVLFEGVNREDKDFNALISKIRSVRAELVYWGGLHDTGGQILRQMRAQGVMATMMGGDGIADDEFSAIAGPGAAGTLMTFSPDPRTNPKNKAIVDLSASNAVSSRRPTRFTATRRSRSSRRRRKRRNRSTRKRSRQLCIRERSSIPCLASFPSTKRATSPAMSSMARRRTVTCSTSGRRCPTAEPPMSRRSNPQRWEILTVILRRSAKPTLDG